MFEPPDLGERPHQTIRRRMRIRRRLNAVPSFDCRRNGSESAHVAGPDGSGWLMKKRHISWSAEMENVVLPTNALI